MVGHCGAVIATLRAVEVCIWPSLAGAYCSQFEFGLGAAPKPLLVALDQVDEARVDGARLGQQPHDGVEDLLEIEGGADRRDDLVQEALLDPLILPPGTDAWILRVGRYAGA